MRHEENYCIVSGSSIGGCPLEEASEQERIPSITGSIVRCCPTSSVSIIKLWFSIWFHISCVVIVFRYLWIYFDILYSGLWFLTQWPLLMPTWKLLDHQIITSKRHKIIEFKLALIFNKQVYKNSLFINPICSITIPSPFLIPMRSYLHIKSMEEWMKPNP